MAKKNYLDRGVDSVGLDDNKKSGASNQTKAADVYQPNYISANAVAKPTYMTNSMAYPTYTPSAAQYSYGKAAPTWNWNQDAPTWEWSQAAPTWKWDDSGKPGEWKWDDSGRPGDFSYKDAPEYQNQYQDQINQMVDNILNRPAFTYDYNEDPLYQMYAEAYTRNGNQAMKDTLGQVAARTGGLASSYAGTAAQQNYNQYMDALNDKVPELYQLAYSMYNNEGNIMRNNLSMVQGLENTDYGRYMDQLGQYNTDRSLAYDQYMNEWNQYNTDRNLSYNQYQDLWDRYYNDRNFSYGQYQDALNQYNADRNFSYGQYQDALGQYNTDRNFSYGQYQDALGQWNTDRNWDYNLWSDNQSRQEAARQAAYQQQVAAYNARQKEIDAYNSAQNAAYQAALKAENDRVAAYNNNQYATYQASLAQQQQNAKNNSSANSSSASGTSSAKSGGNRGALQNMPQYFEDTSYGAWKTADGYQFLGRTYATKDALFNAVANSNLSHDALTNTLNTMLSNGIITQAEYNELRK